MNTFAQRLKAIRRQRGMSQETLAEKVGLSRVYIARLESGRHDPPLSTVVRLAKVLGVTVGGLVK